MKTIQTQTSSIESFRDVNQKNKKIVDNIINKKDKD